MLSWKCYRVGEVAIHRYNCHLSTLRLKKVLTFKLSVTLSNLNRFSKFLHCWKKRMKFATKPIQDYPYHLRHVATLPWKIKNSNFLHIFSRCGERNANKLHFKCTDFNSSMHVTVYAECVYVFF